MDTTLLFPFAEYWWLYAGFTAFVLALLALDLGVFHRHAHVVSFREALVWSVVWVSLALLFNYAFYRYAAWQFPRTRGCIAGFDAAAARDASLEFLTGYLVEKSLAIDNIFVFVLVFAYFAHPAEVPAPRAVLRHHRRARVPRDLHRARLGADAVPAGGRRLRRVPDRSPA